MIRLWPLPTTLHIRLLEHRAKIRILCRWLHHWVWLLGEEEEAGQYTYEITAFKGNTK